MGLLILRLVNNYNILIIRVYERLSTLTLDHIRFVYLKADIMQKRDVDNEEERLSNL
ncbi:hypothetical protein QF042_004643 [Pedobacter sp. W3I1]|uniref:hypothetical protein n=1 Tax=Pedobacter sp. W3I1 TaxID=3042291 RepID=UPI00277FC1D2|nr:hypothetical protein [Pedobacter sp. W3I1]MDQ0641078.1 hypothetical protein [Pedobacter sp. W3I1]